MGSGRLARVPLWRKVGSALVLAVLTFGVVAGLSACGPRLDADDAATRKLAPNELRISKQDFGEAWPFKVDSGILAGYGSGGVGQVVFTANGVTYALNETAARTGACDKVSAVWADDPSKPGEKKDLGPVIARGLQLCP